MAISAVVQFGKISRGMMVVLQVKFHSSTVKDRLEARLQVEEVLQLRERARTS